MTAAEITCPFCLTTSRNRNDVELRFCSSCHVFIDVELNEHDVRQQFHEEQHPFEESTREAIRRIAACWTIGDDEVTYTECPWSIIVRDR